ncbi:MAG: exodeoxyribonuclease III [Deltaproteobacteria bacterium]|nr:MAG: exodeoxyribonuclease III [Deltaproteobacteria bacterium]
MRVVTWNVNSLKVRLPQMLPWLEEADPDVLCLQEIKCTEDKVPYAALAERGYTHHVVWSERTYNGVAIFSKHPIEDPRQGFAAGHDHPAFMPNKDGNPQTRLVSGLIKGVRIVDVYVPNGSRVGSEKFAYKMAWLAFLRRELEEYAGEEVLLCGDMNIALTDRDVWDPFECDGSLLYHPAERDALNRVLGFGLSDAYRHVHPETTDYSWYDYRGGALWKNQGFRIDHVFVTEGLLPRLTEAQMWKSVRKLDKPSDHLPVGVDLDV